VQHAIKPEAKSDQKSKAKPGTKSDAKSGAKPGAKKIAGLKPAIKKTIKKEE
jgi:hypothetical protein